MLPISKIQIPKKPKVSNYIYTNENLMDEVIF